ncbi:MAG: YdcF family protein [Kiloniellaceae bacterium]
METAFFFVSKIAWFLLKPLHSLVLLLLLWLFSRRLGWSRLARLFFVTLLLYSAVIFATPLPEFAVRSLESRFAVPPLAAGDIAGIIVLGGATDDGAVAAGREQVGLNGAAERLTTALALHREMPELEIIVSGFSGHLRPRGWNEAEITRLFFAQQAADLSKVRFEAESRNTAENARNTAALLETGARPWLLVTSAAHMPRAVATFRAEGLSVLPYPVDYRTEPDNLVWPRDLGGSLSDAGVALHEWLGLVVYYVTERSSALFPAP